MPITTTQRDLRIRDIRHRPTVGMDGAKHLLDLSEDEVIALIDEGFLSYAWNIGLGPDRREIRILRESIDHYRATLGSRTHDLNEIAALKLVLPPGHTKPFLTNGEIQRSLNCVSEHVLNLIAAGQLRLQPDTTISRGPNGAALITVPSFKTFLTYRRLP